MNILFAIKTGINRSFRLPILERNWVKYCDYLYFSDYTSPKYENMIKTTDRQDYHGAGEKGINFLNMLKDFQTSDGRLYDVYDWIFYADDDTFINLKTLNKFLKQCDKSKVYGYIFNYDRDGANPVYANNLISKENKFPSGGGGVLIGTDALKKIDRFEVFTALTHGFDDVDMGLNFDKHGIEQIDPGLFYTQSPEFEGHKQEQILKSITYHNTGETVMDELYQKIYRYCNNDN
jgi:hypothetical protein